MSWIYAEDWAFLDLRISDNGRSGAAMQSVRWWTVAAVLLSAATLLMAALLRPFSPAFEAVAEPSHQCFDKAPHDCGLWD